MQKEYARMEPERWPETRSTDPKMAPVQAADRLLRGEEVPRDMEVVARRLREDEVYRALATEDQVEDRLRDLREGLEGLAGCCSPPSPGEGKESVDRLAAEAARLGDFQERMREETASMKNAGADRISQAASLEAQAADLAGQLEPMARDTSRNWPALSPEGAEGLRRAAEDMRKAGGALEKAKPDEASEQAGAALGSLQRTGNQLAEAAAILQAAMEFRQTARALATLDRVAADHEAFSERADAATRSAAPAEASQPGPLNISSPVGLRRLADHAEEVAEGLRDLAEQAPRAVASRGEESEACRALPGLAKRMSDSASAMQQGNIPPDIRPMNDAIRSDLQQLRSEVLSCLASASSAMNQPGVWQPGSEPARGGYQFPPGGEGDGASQDAAAAVPGSDEWAKLPERMLDELEKGAEGKFSAEFAALLRAYYRTLAREPDR